MKYCGSSDSIATKIRMLLIMKKPQGCHPNLHTEYSKIASTYVCDLDHDLDVHMQSIQDLSTFMWKSTAVNMGNFCVLQRCGLLCKTAVPRDF